MKRDSQRATPRPSSRGSRRQSEEKAEKQAVPGTAIEAPREAVEEAAKRTDDYALLNPCDPQWQQDCFTQSDTWRIFRIMSEFVYSFEVMSKV
ncbi:MAG: hypothetical protein M3347_08715, partial [Armatimonadota bacterium]|nr:hypothetical protein [Armatimonadota bacterium]